MTILSIVHFIRKDSFRVLHIALICTCIFALSLAYFVEYILHFSPCPLCIYQRFPYLFIIKISVVAILIKRISKYTLFFIVLNLLGACILAGYHSGVERGIFEPSSLCSTLIHIPKHLSIQDIKEIFYSQPIATCTKPAVKLFNISMTEWNLLLNLSLLFAVLFIWFYPNTTVLRSNTNSEN
ncbi:MAG: disulfide bond formation protein B [Rickettsia endosymbiont of Sergentomyia squamirostris]|uniref:Disulfide bond formation protein B n=1 Tax=Candidatus Tisiphia endosymbiont of Sergentomyia squamirostris TaxID=3113639 RepID=A0AAT9G862_9RICK